LRHAFPALSELDTVTDIGQGFGSIVVETADGIIFRLGRSAASVRGYKREMRLLPALWPRVPVPIPLPQWYRDPSPDFPFGVMGYRKIEGDLLLPENVIPTASPELIDDLAQFLVALHSFPSDEATALDIPVWNAQEEAAEFECAVAAILRNLLNVEECERVARWWDTFLHDDVLKQYEPRLIHGDLWYENLLVNAGATSLVGVLDFEVAAMSDVAQDFATLRYLGDDFATAVLDAYIAHGGEPGPQIGRRIDRLWEYRELPVLPYLVEMNHVPELEAAIQKIRAGPILHGR
jgi:aminoglycoside 2''-phosphotransferase